MSVAKLSFVNRFFPTVTISKQENVTSPNPANCVNTRKLNSVILSPAAKRKGRGVECSAEFYSPSKRRNNFNSKLEYWEILTKSESGNLEKPCDQLMRIKDRDSRSGGSLGAMEGI
jgi:hypothetical protein